MTVTAAASIGCLVSASAAEFVVPEVDVARAAFSYAGDTDFDGGAGSLEVSRFEIRTLLSKPIKPVTDLTVLPFFDYEATNLDFNDTAAGFPIGDEELHSLSLSTFAIYTPQGSPWIYGGWARAEMATDFQDVGGDDFTFDLAAGAGYRFSDTFLLAVGGAVANLNGDVTFYPGISFDWIVSDQVRIGLYGPIFNAAYTPDKDWQFSFRGEPGGDVWNIRDTGGKSRSIDMSSYRVGLFACRRLADNLWLTAGAGATVGNEITLTRPDGDKIADQDLETGMFGQIAVRLRTW